MKTAPSYLLPQPFTMRRHGKGSYVFGGIASILIHVLFFMSVTIPSKVPAPELFEVELISPDALKNIQEHPAPPKQQIVTEPEASTPTDDPQDVRLLAEHSRAVPHEQIRRGDAPQAGPNPLPRSPATEPKHSVVKKDAAPKPQKLALRLATDQLEKTFHDTTPTESSSSGQPSSYRAFSRPQGSGARILGIPGSSDFLPNLPDGDITLLNTKASLHAVFVRRVATRVFGALRTGGWDSLRASDIQRVQDFARVRAVLSPKGELLSVELLGQSGNPRFDEVLQTATKQGARDNNPPKEAAAADGNIHFLFYARSWVQFVPSGRDGFPSERRWLLLSTGLE